MRNRMLTGAGIGLLSAAAMTMGVVGSAGAEQPADTGNAAAVAVKKADPKAAWSCSDSYSDKDSSSYGKPFKGWVNVRSGPSTSCGKTGVVSSVNKADYHCWKAGDGGHSWTYLRFKNNHYGWVRDDQLSDVGSGVRC